ncbi:MAG: hypothetical protein HQL65_01480 [Magnetococcales bacterium]|nr:hypothetical protein [Magnetococcales bacterium]
MIRIDKCKYFNLKKSWKTLSSSSKLNGMPEPSSRLLLFYAVECGLKHLLLRQEPVQCPDNKNNLLYTHKLPDIVKKLRMTATDGKLPPCPKKLFLQENGYTHTQTDSWDVHLAWRYGLEVEKKNESEILQWLDHINHIIGNRINRQ